MPLLRRLAAGEWDTRTTLDVSAAAAAPGASTAALPASESHAARWLVTGYQCVGRRPDLWQHVGDIMQASHAYTTPSTALAEAAIQVQHTGGLLPVVDDNGHVSWGWLQRGRGLQRSCLWLLPLALRGRLHLAPLAGW